MKRKTALFGCLLGLAGSPAAAESLEVMYHDRAPYYITAHSGQVSGIVIFPLRQAFKAAGITPIWSLVAANRQLKVIKADRKQVCAAGWFKKPEREAFARFSKSIYRNKPLVAITRADNSRVLAHSTLRQLLSDATLKMGAKLGYSYGTAVDGLIRDLKPINVTTSQDNKGMIRMLLGRRFDFFFTAQEEANGLIELASYDADELKMATFKDMPDGNHRYLLCSKKTDPALIERINTALAETAK